MCIFNQIRIDQLPSMAVDHYKSIKKIWQAKIDFPNSLMNYAMMRFPICISG